MDAVRDATWLAARGTLRATLTKPTLCIAGLGLMGASLALAVREQYHVIGVARRREACDEALKRGMLHEAHTSLAAGAAQADIVVLATPIRTSIAQIGELAGICKPGTVITELGSTKAEVAAALDALPAHLRAVGSHPMCGKETAGMDVAEAELYRGRPWILSRTARTDEAAFATVKALAEHAGAKTIEIDATRHDKVLAFSSHLPYVMALALMTTADDASSNEPLIYPVMAGGFRDSSRVAASDETMWVDILLSNAGNIVGAMRDAQFQLDQLAALIERKDAPGLRAFITNAAGARREKVLVR